MAKTKDPNKPETDKLTQKNKGRIKLPTPEERAEKNKYIKALHDRIVQEEKDRVRLPTEELTGKTKTISANLSMQGAVNSNKNINNVSDKEVSMDTNFEKYIDARFDNIQERFTYIKENIKETRGEIKELTNNIEKFKYWFIGTTLTIVISLGGLFFAVVGYHAAVMQSQMQVFSDYVKSEVQRVAPKAP